MVQVKDIYCYVEREEEEGGWDEEVQRGGFDEQFHKKIKVEEEGEEDDDEDDDVDDRKEGEEEPSTPEKKPAPGSKRAAGTAYFRISTPEKQAGPSRKEARGTPLEPNKGAAPKQRANSREDHKVTGRRDQESAWVRQAPAGSAQERLGAPLRA